MKHNTRCAAVALMGLSITAQASISPQQIPLTEADFVIDAQLDEPAWQRALVVTLAYETRPGENLPARVHTEALLIDNGGALVIGFRAQDPDPTHIRAYLHDRDAAYQDDMIGVVLDTFNDERRALEFFVNPLGAQMDLIQDDVNNNEDDSWDAIWDAAGRLTDFGYVVEMEIPYTALQLPDIEGGQTWGIDLIRFYPRDQRYRLSNNRQDRNVSCYLCQLDKFDGFANASAGTDLEITPTLTITRADQRQDIRADNLERGSVDYQAGMDLSWGLSPNVTLNGTINPDFSQVEADVAQLDVNTTFTLFFPEKRPFFLEGADFFQTPLNTVYTRNVSDPDYGVRLSGKTGRHAFGVFLADDTVTNFIVPGPLSSDIARLDLSSRNLAARYRRDVGANSSLGLLATARSGNGYHNYLGGIDGQLRLSESDTLSFQYLDSDTRYPDQVVADFDQAQSLSGNAYHVAYDHGSRNWFAYARHSYFDRQFRADLGFLFQADTDKTVAGGGYRWWGQEEHWWSRIQVNGDWDIAHDNEGRLLEREIEAQASIQGPMQSFVELGIGQRDRRWNDILFDESFAFLYGEFQPLAGVFVGLYTRKGDAIDFANTALGDVLELNPQINFNIGRHWQFRTRHNYQQLKRQGGTVFTANQSDLRIAYQFDLRQRLRLTLQYTDIERDPDLYIAPVNRKLRRLGTQLIYSYKVNPRTVLFAGYSDSGIEDDRVDQLVTTNRTLFLKFGYAWEPTF